jgi:hypothetical protein
VRFDHFSAELERGYRLFAGDGRKVFKKFVE